MILLPFFVWAGVYAAVIALAAFIHLYYPAFFSEHGAIENLSVILYAVAIAAYCRRGLIQRLGWLPILVLLLLINREAAISHYIAYDYFELTKQQYRAIMVPAILILLAAASWHFIKHHIKCLKSILRPSLPLLSLAAFYTCASIIFSYLGEKVMKNGVWLEETSEMLFGVLVIYMIIRLPFYQLNTAVFIDHNS